MNFFESQDIARRNTKLLLLLFFLAVGSLVVLTNLILFAFVNFQDSAALATGRFHYTWETFAAVSVGVIVLIALASLFRMAGLRQGGSAVAELMDGVLLADAGGDLNKRKLLNVVEEMAIASGTPVPPVYLIQDSAINAFAAGYSPGDAVIGVTVGAMENLSRNELQGVIAHEFSHILNGDMRLNIKLIGMLYGILMIAIVGRILLSPVRHGSRGRSQGGIVALGIGLMFAGYVGQFFGNLIKAAVSRQREYLADASAVQFTRNPKGIAGALKRIGGYTDGSILTHPEASELSHTFFSEGIAFSFSGLMATHPPLEKRISKLDPSWDGAYQLENSADPSTGEHNEGAMGFAAGSPSGTVSIDADEVIEHIGNPNSSQVELARQIIAGLPAIYTQAAHEPYSARALVYLLQLSDEGDVRESQLEQLKAAADFGVYDALVQLMVSEDLLRPEMKLPLLEIAFPTLRQLSYEQYKLFTANLDVLIRADGKVALSEWAVQKMISKHLGEVFENRHSRVTHNSLKSVKEHCQVLLSLLAYCDKQSGVEPAVAFSAGQKALELDMSLLKTSDLSFGRMNRALDELANLHPLRKPKLLKACVSAITADQKVSVIESELLRTIADTLECPMPPIAVSL
jgi:Zn-dependent protease with chaperone function/uncharacterized tellurite resistance protein B-like protein